MQFHKARGASMLHDDTTAMSIMAIGTCCRREAAMHAGRNLTTMASKKAGIDDMPGRREKYGQIGADKNRAEVSDGPLRLSH